ncbi:uncharacterized protein si:ch211-151h10.2 isoform X2 [Austrofundulus limnaeus]|uniref:Uncharacterized protein si:ch211-151h10.2 isoform X2 n=1 Tax=Austrofundulus limnaeus TaxID=52670 RepID=A0A2I4BUD6_AUSLI|nr:PREDICTED: uncharacterized protein LOC106522738 isoform X2 [Austrofundulus limnaeus]
MPCLNVVHPRGQGVTGRGHTGDRDGTWMKEEEPAEQNQRSFSLNPTSAEAQPKQNFWCRALRTFGPGSSFAPAGVVCLVLLLEALLDPSLSPEALCCQILVLSFLWVFLGGCLHALKSHLEPELKEQQLVLTQSSLLSQTRTTRTRMFRSRTPDVPLSMALTDSLLLCVLQELLQEPALTHIQALLSKLQAVAQTLESAGPDPVQEVDLNSSLTEKLKLLSSYLQHRTGLLQSLVQVQGDFETSSRDLLWGLQELWIQLEELHTGVTLSKQEGWGYRDLTSVKTDAQTLVAELGRYRKRLESCEAHLKASTQLLQELTWSHAHFSTKLNLSSTESVWPELLLQSNMEKFDKVQESFSPLEQQTHTFQTHLQGLGDGHLQEGPLARTDVAPVSSPLPQTSTKTPPLSLRERTARLSSSLKRLHRAGKQK